MPPSNSPKSTSSEVSPSSGKPDKSQSKGLFAADGRFTAVFNLAAATLGAGALAIPISILNAGLVGGVLLLGLMAMLSLLSITMIAKACHMAGKSTYEELIQHLFGKYVAYFFDLVMVLFCFGTCVTYMISLFDILNPVMVQLLGADPSNWFAQLLVTRESFTALMTVLVLLPLSLREHISEIRYVTFIGVLGVCFLGVTSVYVLARYGVAEHLPSDAIVPLNGWTSLMAAVNTYTFAYCNQPNVPEIFEQLANPTPKRFLPVVMWTIFICFSVYVTIGVSCLYAFGSDVNSSVIVNMGQYISAGDPMVCVAFALMCVSVMGAFPLVVYPQRSSIVHVITETFPTESKRTKRVYGVVVVLVVLALSYIVAIALPDVNVMLGLVGSLTGSIICFFFPAAFMLKLSDKKLFCASHLVYFMLIVIGTFALVLGTYTSVSSAIDYFN